KRTNDVLPKPDNLKSYRQLAAGVGDGRRIRSTTLNAVPDVAGVYASGIRKQEEGGVAAWSSQGRPLQGAALSFALVGPASA
ncbi:hypothetical protein, partial [Mesorhizobium sp.]|uniref:hypothetical protein n=1 Tax=Mesorhizobium sp. TaxID=1871066 RepID=UPI0025FEAC34